MISYVMGPNPFLQFTDKDGVFVSNGFLGTFDFATRQPKPIYRDPAGLKPYPNPTPLDSAGRIDNPFWENDNPYYLILYSKDAISGGPGPAIWKSSEPYVPSSGGGSNIVTNVEFENLFLNGQMRFFDQILISPIPVGIKENVASGGWFFEKDGNNDEDAIEFILFLPDNYSVDATPIYNFNYRSLNPGNLETIKDFCFPIKDVRSLSNEEISISIEARSSLSGVQQIQLICRQFFGKAGNGVNPSPTVETNLGIFSLTTNFQKFDLTTTIPSLIGKTVGVEEDDRLEIRFRFPLNINSDIQITNFILKRGSAPINYPYKTYAEQLSELNRLDFPQPNNTTFFPEDNYYKYPSEQAYNCLQLIPSDENKLIESWEPPIPIGTVLPFPSDVAPAGYVVADGSVVPKGGQYNRLFQVPFSNDVVFGRAYSLPGSFDNIVLNNFFSGLPRFTFRTTFPDVINLPSVATTPFSILNIALPHPRTDVFIFFDKNTPLKFKTTNDFNGGVNSPATTNTVMNINVLSNGFFNSPAEWEITVTNASNLSAGQYVSWSSRISNNGPINQYYAWFEIDGVGTDPVLPGATAYKLSILSDFNETDIRQALIDVITGRQDNLITFTDASQITSGMYFTVFIESAEYNIFYVKDDNFVIPSVPNLIPVKISSSDDAISVARKTELIFTPLLFKLPDWRGAFIRGWDNGRGLDNPSLRLPRGDGTEEDNVGTFQNLGSLGIVNQPLGVPNYYFNYIIKY